MLLLWVLFSVLSAYQAYAIEDFELNQFREVCTGRDLVFPSDFIRTRKVFFTPKSPLGSTRMVIDEGKVLDPRFTSEMGVYVKLLDVTVDYEGTYSVGLPGTNKTVNLLTLSVYDCSKEKRVHTEYGRSYSFDVSRPVEQIDYSPFNDSQMPVILWNRTKAIEKAGWTLKNKRFVEKRFTPKDQGFYTLRDIRGEFLERYRISIKEVQQNHTFNTGENFTISFPVDGVQFSLSYQAEGVGVPVTLIQDGNLVNSEAFDGRIKLLSTGVEIRELEVPDGGIFKLQDSDGNLALVVELTVWPQAIAEFLYSAEYAYTFFPILWAFVAGVPGFLICLCIIKMYCCRPKSRASSPVTQVYHHETTTNDQRQSQPYAMVVNPSPYNPRTPLASAANQQPQASDILNPPSYNDVAGGGGNLGPSSTSVTPAHVGPVYFQPGDWGPSSTYTGVSHSHTQVGPIHYQSKTFVAGDGGDSDPFSKFPEIFKTVFAGGGGNLGPSSTSTTQTNVGPVHYQSKTFGTGDGGDSDPFSKFPEIFKNFAAGGGGGDLGPSSTSTTQTNVGPVHFQSKTFVAGDGGDSDPFSKFPEIFKNFGTGDGGDSDPFSKFPEIFKNFAAGGGGGDLGPSSTSTTQTNVGPVHFQSNTFVAGDGGDLGPSSTSATPADVGPVHFQPNTFAAGDLGPSSTSATPGNVGPVHFQGSAVGVDAPTVTLGFDCLSSGSGTQFEVPKGNDPSAPFLSSDTPSNDVYTSDKLNFL